MGLTQKAFGSLFERLFYSLCMRIPGMAVTRFPDGCRTLARNKVVRVKTPCDWILTYGGVTALIDTKTTQSDSFAYSKIEKHQINEMILHSRAGAKSGYVIWFRKSDDVVFCSSVLLGSLMNQRGSFKIQNDLQGNSNYLGKSRDFQAKLIFGDH